MTIGSDIGTDARVGGAVASPSITQGLTELDVLLAMENAAPDGLLVVGPDGRIVRANRRMGELAGCDPAELVGRSVETLVPHGSRPAHRRARARYLADPRVRPMGAGLALALRRRDGSELPVDVAQAPLRTPVGTFVLAAVRDDRLRRAAEAENRAQARQLAAVAELSHLAIVGEAPEVVMERAAKLVAETLCVDRAEVLELAPDGGELRVRAAVGWPEEPVRELGVPVDPRSPAGLALASRETVVVEDLANDGRFGDPETPLARGVASGVCVVVPGRDRPFGVLGAYGREPRSFSTNAIDLLQSIANILGDVIERTRADAAVRASERRLAEAQRIAHLGSWEWDIVADEIVWSDEVYRIFGLSSERPPLSYGEFLDAVHAEDRGAVDRAVRAALEQGRPYSIQHRVVRPDGSERVVHERGEVTRDPGGKPVRMVGTVLDVTERRRMEEELERRLERLRKLERTRRLLLAHLVRAREEEAARIAGDIHDDPLQKLAALSLRLGMLREALEDRGLAQQLAAVERTVGQAIASLRTLLFELRPVALDREGLAAAVRELLERIGEEAGFTSEVQVVGDGEPESENRIVCYRIIQEAITNVRKHARASRVSVRIEQLRDGTRVQIRDDGVGFDPGRVHQAPGHLGLPAMRERAELAGGWLRVDSARGAGTAVEFWIPA